MSDTVKTNGTLAIDRDELHDSPEYKKQADALVDYKRRSSLVETERDKALSELTAMTAERDRLRALLADALDALTDGGVICDGVEPLKVDSPCKVCRTVARIRVELGDDK